MTVTTTNIPTPRSNIADLAPYPLGSGVSGSNSNVLHLEYNEHWEGISESARQACILALDHSHLYPETSAYHLRQAIADLHQIDHTRIVCANGSSELITLLCQIYCNPGDEAIVGPYSYLYFRTAALISGATPITPGDREVVLTPAALLEKVTKKTKIVFLDNPQNPIGGYLNRNDLIHLRENLPDHVLLVIDAAYAEYVDKEDYESGMELVNRYDNCVMLRTFSKIYGLAGLRIGWAYGSPDVAGLIHKVRQPNNLSNISIAAANAALTEQSLVSRRQNETKELRQKFSDDLANRWNFSPVPSVTNFVLAGLPKQCQFDAAGLTGELSKQDILIRPMGAYGLPDHVRITVGSSQSMEKLIDTLNEILT